jgi:hypothetical protein
MTSTPEISAAARSPRVALHVVDDSFLQPNPGTSAGAHLPGGLDLALLVVAGVLYERLRAGARAVMALLAGFFGVLAGTEAVYYTSQVGPSGDDYTGLLSLPAGPVLLRLAAVTLWRSRRTGADVDFTTSDGLRLEGWYVRSRNGAPTRRSRRRCSRATATAGCSSTAAARARAVRHEPVRLARGARRARRRRVPAAPARRRPDADRRDRPVGRRRDDDRGGRRVPRPPGHRVRGRERPLGARSAREPGDGLARGARQRRDHRSDGALHRQPAARRPVEPGAADGAAPGVLRLRRGQPTEEPANEAFYAEARGPIGS